MATDSGLARQHLMSGYPDHAWKFYQNGKAESVDICNEIKVCKIFIVEMPILYLL
jgi:hypothetical protein